MNYEDEFYSETKEFARDYNNLQPHIYNDRYVEWLESRLDAAIPKGKIVTSYIYPSIPDKNCSWKAVRKRWQKGDLIGYGPTKLKAINDLIRQENEI